MVVGICAINTASFASDVPGTEARIALAGLDNGIFAKSLGRFSDAKVHGPVRLGALKQRPAAR